jgi:Transposase DDE domain
MTRRVHEHLLERMQQRVEANPTMMKRRKQIVRHPFGTMKHWYDQGYFLMKGLEKVGAAFSLSTLAYNLRRVVTIFGVSHRLRALA